MQRKLPGFVITSLDIWQFSFVLLYTTVTVKHKSCMVECSPNVVNLCVKFILIEMFVSSNNLFQNNDSWNVVVSKEKGVDDEIAIYRWFSIVKLALGCKVVTYLVDSSFFLLNENSISIRKVKTASSQFKVLFFLNS